MLDSAYAIKFRDIARDAQALALEFERGQASTPLTEHCLALGDGLQEHPFTAALVTHDAAARDITLSWLLGEPHRRVSVHMGRFGALPEIRLQDHGYGLETASGRNLQFESLEQLLLALGDNAAGFDSTNTSGELLRISLATQVSSQGISLLVVDGLSAGGLGPGLVSTLLRRCQLLVFASRSAPPAMLLENLAHLALGIGAVLPTNCGDWQPSTWSLTLRKAGVAVLEPADLAPTASAPTSPFSGAFASLQSLLLVGSHARRLQLAIEAIRERYEKDLRRLQVQRQREESTARTDAPGASGDVNSRRPFDQARNSAVDDIASLGKSIQECARRSLLPEGNITQALSEQLASLRSEDFDRELGPKTIKLSLSQEYQIHLQRALRKALKTELVGDLRSLRDTLDVTKASFEASLEETLNQPINLVLPSAPESEIWSHLGELINVEIKYRGEIPKRGLMQRLGEGRKMVFAVMMILSFVGSMAGFSWRGMGGVGIGFLAIFIGAVFYTFRSWRGQDAERIDMELGRVREQLLQECRRVAAEVQREKQQQLGEHLDQVKRILVARLDDIQREQLRLEGDQLSQQRERARVRLRKLELQLRDLGGQGTRLTKLRHEATALVNDSARAIRDAAARIAGAKAAA